ncbi:MAG: hypothetical protein KAZ88_11235 [Acidimicrobiia bacterium]|nr:hypothetical protein [Acidimicrobiia bacterium]
MPSEHDKPATKRRHTRLDWRLTAFIAFVACVATWPILSVTPGFDPTGHWGGLDISWVTASHVIARRGLSYGNDVVFTYGPWGFLGMPRMYSTITGIAAVVAVLAAHGVLGYHSARTFRRYAPWPIALIATFYLLRFTSQLMLPSAALAAVLATLVVAWAIVQVINERRFSTVTLVAAGLLCALIVTMKLNDGLNAAAAVGLMATGLGWKHGGWRQALKCGGIVTASWFAGVLVWWMVAGQNPANLGEWARVSLQLASGYGDAMGITEPGRSWQIPAAALTVLVVVAIALLRLRRHAPVLRLTVLAILAVHWAIMGTWSFVRHDAHATAFFATTLVILLAFWHRGTIRFAAPASIALAITAWLVVLPPGADKQWDRAALPWEWSFLQDTVKGVTTDRAELMDTSREALRETYALSPEMVERLTGSTVHIDPQEATVAWAYPEFAWDPLPIYQEYQAYSAPLDDLNAERLADDDRGPTYVLRENVTVDDRIARFEAPAVMLELVCGFAQDDETERWVLFERAEDRCGKTSPLGTAATDDAGLADLSELLSQAGPNDIVVARWPDVERRNRGLASSLWKGDPWYAAVTADSAPGRIIPALSGQWHIVEVPDCLNISPIALDTDPIASMTFLRGAPPAHEPEADIEVELATISYRCP